MRRSRAGDEVATSELTEAGWPGERILTQAARSRVHVAINTLRRLGLGEYLERGKVGYRARAIAPRRREPLRSRARRSAPRRALGFDPRRDDER